MRAAQADYLPEVTALAQYFHQQGRRHEKRRHERGGEDRHDQAFWSAAGRGKESERDEGHEICGEHAPPDAGHEQAPRRDGRDRHEGERDGQDPGRQEHAAMIWPATGRPTAVPDTIICVTTDVAATWRDVDPDELAPVVLVAPGFLTMPGWYDDLAARLRDEIERLGGIAKLLRHLPSLLVPDHSGEINILENPPLTGGFSMLGYCP